jgi:hypothetical protein
VSDIADQFPEGTFRDPDTDEEDVAEEEEAPDTADVGDEGVDDGEEGDGAAAEAPLIFGKYKTIEDAEKAHKELERQFHESRQQPPEPDEEEAPQDEDPFGVWGSVLGADDAQPLAEIIIQEPARAQEVIEWVTENQHEFGYRGPQVVSQLFALWQAQDPVAATDWRVETIIAARAEEMEASYAQHLEPLQSAHTQQMVQATIARFANEYPNATEYLPKVMERLQTPDVQNVIAQDPAYQTDPEKMFGLLQAAMSQIALEEWQTNMRLAANDAGQASETPAKKPRTQARSSVAKPPPDETVDMFPAGTFRAG